MGLGCFQLGGAQPPLGGYVATSVLLGCRSWVDDRSPYNSPPMHVVLARFEDLQPAAPDQYVRGLERGPAVPKGPGTKDKNISQGEIAALPCLQPIQQPLWR